MSIVVGKPWLKTSFLCIVETGCWQLPGPHPTACPGGRKGGWSFPLWLTGSSQPSQQWGPRPIGGTWYVASLCCFSLQWHGDSPLFSLGIFQVLLLFNRRLKEFQCLTMSMTLITQCLYLHISRTRVLLFCKKKLGTLPFYFMVLNKIYGIRMILEMWTYLVVTQLVEEF